MYEKLIIKQFLLFENAQLFLLIALKSVTKKKKPTTHFIGYIHLYFSLFKTGID